MASLAQEYYGKSIPRSNWYCPFSASPNSRDGLIEIPTGRQTNPHIQFFEQKNPGYRLGDELVCLTEINYDNLTRAGQRMWEAESSLKFVQDCVLI